MIKKKKHLFNFKRRSYEKIIFSVSVVFVSVSFVANATDRVVALFANHEIEQQIEEQSQQQLVLQPALNFSNQDSFMSHSSHGSHVFHSFHSSHRSHSFHYSSR
ncbi:hypothetical protein [uncultured Bacteroides sp.]|uniref:hypothetical protein n=1 Tax=uncultured Bacteroides sp. TaxID=162156 RepID=UPI00263387D1|nr:hypothetical protein [uncultured Bacteroides sp.]